MAKKKADDAEVGVPVDTEQQDRYPAGVPVDFEASASIDDGRTAANTKEK